MRYLYTAIVALLSLLLSSNVTAQEFDNVSIADASSICSISQDEQGILWFGSDNGLYSYECNHLSTLFLVMAMPPG